jgi:hypothetical protein
MVASEHGQSDAADTMGEHRQSDAANALEITG